MKVDLRCRRLLLRTLLFRRLGPLSPVRAMALSRLLGAPQLHCGSRINLHTSHLRPGRSDLVVGRGVQIGDEVLLDVTGRLDIADEVTISERASVYTHNHNVESAERHWRMQGITVSDVVLEEQCWAGAGATILASSARIGRGAIVGAGSVVTKPVAPFSIVAGNPAREIGVRGQL